MKLFCGLTALACVPVALARNGAALQIVDAKRSCALVDGPFAWNSDLRSLVYGSAVRERLRDRPQKSPLGGSKNCISTIGGHGLNGHVVYPSILLIIGRLPLALRLAFGSK